MLKINTRSSGLDRIPLGPGNESCLVRLGSSLQRDNQYESGSLDFKIVQEFTCIDLGLLISLVDDALLQKDLIDDFSIWHLSCIYFREHKFIVHEYLESSSRKKVALDHVSYVEGSKAI
jgi:hypothetical protein